MTIIILINLASVFSQVHVVYGEYAVRYLRLNNVTFIAPNAVAQPGLLSGRTKVGCLRFCVEIFYIICLILMKKSEDKKSSSTNETKFRGLRDFPNLLVLFVVWHTDVFEIGGVTPWISLDTTVVKCQHTA